MAPDNVFEAETQRSDFYDGKSDASRQATSGSKTMNIIKALLYGTHLALKHED